MEGWRALAHWYWFAAGPRLRAWGWARGRAAPTSRVVACACAWVGVDALRLATAEVGCPGVKNAERELPPAALASFGPPDAGAKPVLPPQPGVQCGTYTRRGTRGEARTHREGRVVYIYQKPASPHYQHTTKTPLQQHLRSSGSAPPPCWRVRQGKAESPPPGGVITPHGAAPGVLQAAPGRGASRCPADRVGRRSLARVDASGSKAQRHQLLLDQGLSPISLPACSSDTCRNSGKLSLLSLLSPLPSSLTRTLSPAQPGWPTPDSTAPRPAHPAAPLPAPLAPHPPCCAGSLQAAPAACSPCRRRPSGGGPASQRDATPRNAACKACSCRTFP